MNRSGTTKIGPLCLGTSGLGGVFGDDIDETVAANVIELCFSLGWTVIDTAPWYRNSEIVVGRALQRLRYDREKYVIATKCGRYCNSETQFDYSEETVSKSVQQSLLNLHTSYLDIVYIHDVEFQPIENTLQLALPALVKLQEQGIVDRIGICGYPLHILDTILSQTDKIQVVQTYCHGTLQNDTVRDFARKWSEKGVLVMNAAPLAMGLLTSCGPPEWHPAPAALRDRCKHAAQICDFCYGTPIQVFALQYSLNNVAHLAHNEEAQQHKKAITGTVIGCVSTSQVNEAQLAWQSGPVDSDIVREIRSAITDEWIDWQWPSGATD